jgi:hypothetical protein
LLAIREATWLSKAERFTVPFAEIILLTSDGKDVNGGVDAYALK